MSRIRPPLNSLHNFLPLLPLFFLYYCYNSATSICTHRLILHSHCHKVSLPFIHGYNARENVTIQLVLYFSVLSLPQRLTRISSNVRFSTPRKIQFPVGEIEIVANSMVNSSERKGTLNYLGAYGPFT